jgi:hypothetical protein
MATSVASDVPVGAAAYAALAGRELTHQYGDGHSAVGVSALAAGA